MFYQTFNLGASPDIIGYGNKDCFQYNYQNDAWTVLLSSNLTHMYSPGTIYKNKLYLFDANNFHSEVFDLTNKSLLERVAPPTSAGYGACTVQFLDTVLVIGGQSFRFVIWLALSMGGSIVFLKIIFISPLFDIENLTCYADNKFPLVQERQRSELVIKMQKSLKILLHG